MFIAKSGDHSIRAAARLKGLPFRCPHCHCEVRIRAGKGIQPHFFHVGETCEQSRSDDAAYHPLSNLCLLSHAETRALEVLALRFGGRKMRMREMMDTLLAENVKTHRQKLIQGIIEAGWMSKGEASEWGNYGFQTWNEYTLDPAIVELFHAADIASFDGFWKRTYQAFPKLLHFYETIEAAHAAAKDTPFRLGELPMRSYDAWRAGRIREVLPVLRGWYEKSLYVLKITTRTRIAMKVGVTTDFATRFAALQSESEFAMGEKTQLETILVLPNRGYLEAFLKRMLAETRVSVEFTEYFEWNESIVNKLKCLKNG
jgi:T5orf172 domain